MLIFKGSDDKQSTCFRFIGADSKPTATNLLSDNTCLLSSNRSSANISADTGLDTCSFYFGPSDSDLIAFAENYESSDLIAYTGNSESCGSIAYSGGSESCGSIASSSSSFSGGCSYSC